MVEEEGGSPEKGEIGDEFDLLEIDTLWRIMEEPSNPPLVNSVFIFSPLILLVEFC